MSYELNHEQARTAALAAQHAVRTLAQCLTANQREISAKDVAAVEIGILLRP